MTSTMESPEWVNNLTFLTILITSGLSSCLGDLGRQLNNFFKGALRIWEARAEQGSEEERPQCRTVSKTIRRTPSSESRLDN